MADDFFSWAAGLESSGYTVPMTIIYALLVILGLYILYRWVKHEKIPTNTAFVLSSCIYVILGGLLHVIDDMTVAGSNFVPYPWRLCFTTPLVYIFVMVFGLIVLFISYQFEKKKIILTYVKPFATTGVVACLIVLGILGWYGLSYATFDVAVIGIVVEIAAAATAALWAILRFVCRWKYVTHPLYLALMFCQYLDSSATGFALELHPVSYYEQHVLGDWLINLSGTGYSMFILKMIVLVIGIFVLEKFRKQEGFTVPWHLTILVMIIVGLGPSIRDIFRMVLWI